MKKKVILINGLARCGKDTIANYMKEILEDKEIKTEIISFAGPLKQIIEKTFDITSNELDYYKNHIDEISIIVSQENKNTFTPLFSTNFRRILQRFGTEGMKPVFGDDVWARIAKDWIKNTESDVVIIPDFRFQIEANTILELANEDIADIYFVYIYSDMSTISENQHQSEKDLEGFCFDYTINNMEGELLKTQFISSKVLIDILDNHIIVE